MAALKQEDYKLATTTYNSNTRSKPFHCSSHTDPMKQMANEIETMPGAKLLPTPSETDKSRPSDNGGNTFCNVHYSDCNTDPTMTFTGCELENVYFIHCKFKDTQFCHVKLANVVLMNIDLNNVILLNIDLEDYSWKNVMARNTVLSHEQLTAEVDERITPLQPYKPLPQSENLPFLVTESRGIELLSPGAARSLGQYERSFRNSVRVDKILRPDLLACLMDHEYIMSRIIDTLASRLQHIRFCCDVLAPTSKRVSQAG